MPSFTNGIHISHLALTAKWWIDQISVIIHFKNEETKA